MKKSKIIIYLIFLIHPFFSFSHVSHYDKLKLIEMDILRNGKKIGHNKYSFENQNNLLVVKNEINFVAKLVGITRNSVTSIRNKSYWNYNNLNPKDPVALNLFTQKDLVDALEKAERRIKREKKDKEKQNKTN